MKIFIIGFMGTGKSHWGKIWAARKGLAFFDLDTEIEKEAGLSVAAIFEKKGETYFRETESAALRKFSDVENFILSCGGGTPCQDDNMGWMNAQGTTVCLSAGPQTILQRVMSEQEKRPLVKRLNEAELLFFIEQKLKEREPFYSKAKFQLHSEELDENSLDEIIKK